MCSGFEGYMSVKGLTTHMNKLILAKMRGGDWGEVVRLMRKDRQIEDFALQCREMDKNSLLTVE